MEIFRQFRFSGKDAVMRQYKKYSCTLKEVLRNNIYSNLSIKTTSDIQMTILKSCFIALATILFSQTALSTYYFKVLQLHKAGHTGNKSTMPEVGYIEVNCENNQLSAFMFVNGIQEPLNINITWSNFSYCFSINPGTTPRSLTNSTAPVKQTPLLESISSTSPHGLTTSIATAATTNWQVELNGEHIIGLQNLKSGRPSRYGNLYVQYPHGKRIQPNNVNLYARRLLLLPVGSRPARSTTTTFEHYTNDDAKVTFELLTTTALLFNYHPYTSPHSSISQPTTVDELPDSATNVEGSHQRPDNLDCGEDTFLVVLVKSLLVIKNDTVLLPPHQCKDGGYKGNHFPDIDPAGGSGAFSL